jgi:hypothetical protein
VSSGQGRAEGREGQCRSEGTAGLSAGQSRAEGRVGQAAWQRVGHGQGLNANQVMGSRQGNF